MAAESYHQWEYRLNYESIFNGVESEARGELYMMTFALRCMTLRPPDYFFIQHREAFEGMRAEDDCDVVQLGISLVTHYNHMHLLNALAKTLIMLYWLEIAKYFVEDKDRLLAAKLLLHFFAVLHSNNHQIQGKETLMSVQCGIRLNFDEER